MLLDLQGVYQEPWTRKFICTPGRAGPFAPWEVDPTREGDFDLLQDQVRLASVLSPLNGPEDVSRPFSADIAIQAAVHGQGSFLRIREGTRSRDIN